MADTVIFKIEVENKDAKKKINDTKDDFKKLEDQLNLTAKIVLGFAKAAETAYNAFKNFDPALMAANAAINTAKASWEVFTWSLKAGMNVLHSLWDIGVNVFKSIASATSDFVVDSIKNFANYEDILTHAGRTLNLTKEEALALGDSLVKLSQDALKGGVASEELAKIAGMAGQLGIAKQDVLQFTETVAKMAIAFGISAEKTAEGMAIITNVFGLSQDQMRSLGDGITMLGNSTAATADQLINITQKMGAVAEFMGLTAGQTVAIAATLRDVGVSVNVAGSSMSQILSRIMSDYSKFAEVLSIDSASLRSALESNDPSQALFMVLDALNQINATGGKIAATQALKDLGLTGVRTQNSMLLLAGSVDQLRANMQLEQEAEMAGTAINESYAIAIDTAKGKWDQFWEAVSRIQKIIGGPLAEAFSQFMQDYLTPFIVELGDWMESSDLFAKVFDELLPKALDFLGTKVEELRVRFFDFLNSLDKDVDAKVESLKASFMSWIEPTLIQFQQFIADVQEMKISFDDFKNNAKAVWTVFDMSLKNIIILAKATWEVLTVGGQGVIDIIAELYVEVEAFFTDFKDFGGDILTVLDDVGKKIKDALFVPIELATKAMQKLGLIAYEKSVLPDIAIEATRAGTKITGMGDTIEQASGHFKQLYKTGSNTWSNLKKDVAEGATAWQRSEEKIAAGQAATQFSLYETGNAVNQVAQAFTNVGHEIQVFIADVAGPFDNVITLANQAGEAVNNIMVGTAESLAKIGNMGNLTAASLQGLINAPGMMSAGGLIGAAQFQRSQGAEGMPQIGGAMPAMPQGMPSTFTATVNLGGQEIGVITSAINSQNQVNSRQSAGRAGGIGRSF